MKARAPVALRPLAALTAFVLVAHLLMLQEASLSLLPDKAPIVRVAAINTRTLTPAPTPPDVVSAPPALPVAKKRPPLEKKPPRPTAATPSPMPEAAIASNQGEPLPEQSESTTDPMANSTTTESAPDATAMAPAEPASAASGTRPPDGNNLIATAPASVRLLYNLTGQARKMDYNVRSQVLWQQDGRRYAIRLYVSAFLIGSRSQTSEGEITPQGLAPLRYADKWRGEQAAHFNRETQRITFSANTPDAPLLPGAQDRLSLFIQLGALMAAQPGQLAPGNSLTLQTVSPRDAESWVILSEGEERLNLPIGEVMAFKLTRAPRREFDTRVELWYAPSMNYLPVRIRVTQANGDFIDQELRATEPAEDLK